MNKEIYEDYSCKWLLCCVWIMETTQSIKIAVPAVTQESGRQWKTNVTGEEERTGVELEKRT